MKKIINFDQINDKHRELVGNKAFNLAKLNEFGFKTADFFVISNSLFHRAIEKRALPIDLQQEIINKLHESKATKFAVRSSASCEDGKKSSFAGQFESFLSIPKHKVIRAAEDCFKAVFDERIGLYCSYHQVDPSEIKMAVIVQEMIEAQKGGVIFTHDVFNDDGDSLVIEAAQGLGEQVVSGSANADRLIFSKKKGNLIKSEPGGKESVLTTGEAKDLFNLALQIETKFGQAQDIEWAIKDQQIYFLQTRTIT